MIHSETFARDVLAALRPDATVHFRSEQSHGQHDIDLVFADGRRAVVEVASIVDAQQLRVIDAVLAEAQGGEFVPAVTSRGGWHVSPASNVNVRRLRARVDQFLARLERAGVSSFDVRFGEPEDFAGEAERLGLAYGDRVDFVPLGQIQLGLPSSGGWVSPAFVNNAVLEVASRADNLRKLSAGEYDERHIFVYVDSSAHDAHAALLATSEVAAPPILPEPISHAWVGSYGSSLTDGLVWTAANRGPWVRQRIQLPDRRT